MKKKLSVIEALIKAHNLTITEIETKLNLPKGYISKVIDGKQSIKPMILFNLLHELNITLEQYEKLNVKAKELCEDSTIPNEKRWQMLLQQIYLNNPLKNVEEPTHKRKK